jgi:two-component system chemotaxis sensor kinase CheA
MDQIVALLNDITSDFLFLDSDDVDIPTAGKFMNKLDMITTEAEQTGAAPVKAIAVGLNSILEKMVLNKIDDKQKALKNFSRGISVMQEILDRAKNTGIYNGEIKGLLDEITSLTGIVPPKEKENLSRKVESEATATEEKKSDLAEIPDEALLNDFITEALEYIDEIELNVLNMEQNPED